MLRGISLIFLIQTLWGSALAAEPEPALSESLKAKKSPDSHPVDEKKEQRKSKKRESLDLNQVDLEQVEESWDSATKKPFVDMNDTVKIKEIIELPGEYTYASFGKADPFIQTELGLAQAPEKVAVIDQPASGMSKEIQVVSPLQGYPLADLVVKGMWQVESGETRAIILTPKNEGVVVKEGDPISSGKVLAIRRDSLMVRLYRLRSDGVRAFEDIAMKVNAGENKNKGVIKLEPGKEPQFLTPDAERPKPVPSPESLPGVANNAAGIKSDAGKDPNAKSVVPGAAGNKEIQQAKDGAPAPHN